MTALSIHIPEELAKASQKVARKLGISRSSFIRAAILHEVQNFLSQSEEEAMAKSLASMHVDPHYLKAVLVEHCRSITVKRLSYPRLAQLTSAEIGAILHKLQRLIGISI